MTNEEASPSGKPFSKFRLPGSTDAQIIKGLPEEGADNDLVLAIKTYIAIWRTSQKIEQEAPLNWLAERLDEILRLVDKEVHTAQERASFLIQTLRFSETPFTPERVYRIIFDIESSREKDDFIYRIVLDEK